jgi:hypothetical protein
MKTTYFPSVRGTMGDWTYYVTVMGVSDLVRYVNFAEELSPNPDLDSMIQRELTNRAKEIADYLRIPAKANTDSEGNANGIPGRRRTVFGA